jgi:acetyl-CoA carboxylase biotin carboxylase subunit
MFKKILIANRGEIALRTIWACRELGVKTVAVYSSEDADSLHVRFADEDICIGPAPNSASYLNIPAVISAAELTGADAIHPGYGFLAENAHFAEICNACRITFIGPDPSVIRKMGDKARARETMIAAGVPVVPGSEGLVKTEEQAVALAEEIGYPVILKAAAGGGGKGMRTAASETELRDSFKLTQAEATAAFGNGTLYLERFLVNPRHVEFQILGDSQGRVTQLGERDCSIQRRHQKLIEESPSPALDGDLRARMAEMAVAAAKAVNYSSVGTIEFLLDSDRNFYFMEMNTRIQVEHPVTEMVMGVDLIKEQIRIAAGEPLSDGLGNYSHRGHSIECRINAEDPETFAPCPGTLTDLYFPGGPGVRFDSALHGASTVSRYYDSLIAKVITHGADRAEALSRMRRALEAVVIVGVKTSIPFLLQVVDDDDFRRGDYSTGYLEKFMARKKTGLA